MNAKINATANAGYIAYENPESIFLEILENNLGKANEKLVVYSSNNGKESEAFVYDDYMDYQYLNDAFTTLYIKELIFQLNHEDYTNEAANEKIKSIESGKWTKLIEDGEFSKALFATSENVHVGQSITFIVDEADENKSEAYSDKYTNFALICEYNDQETIETDADAVVLKPEVRAEVAAAQIIDWFNEKKRAK